MNVVSYEDGRSDLDPIYADSLAVEGNQFVPTVNFKYRAVDGTAGFRNPDHHLTGIQRALKNPDLARQKPEFHFHWRESCRITLLVKPQWRVSLTNVWWRNSKPVGCGGVNFVKSIIWRWAHRSVDSEGGRMEVEGQSELSDWLRVKLAGIQRKGSGPGTCSLEVLLAEGRRIEIKRDFDAETLARLIRTLEEI